VTLDDDGLPRLSGPGVEVTVRVTGTAAGTLLTVDCRIVVRVGGVSVAGRGRSLAFGRMLTGITTLVAREPLVVMAGALVRDGTVLAARRATGSGAGRWELPGGKVEEGETEQQALAREWHEELGVRVMVGPRLGGDIGMADGLVLRTRRVELSDDGPEPAARDAEHSELRWIRGGELDDLDWLPADRQLLPRLRAILGDPTDI
jgi:8-oxo-dGTP diphosphatase